MSKVVILLSDKRSGSTMFQQELCRHPDIQTVPYSPHTYEETHWWLMAAVLLDRPGRLFAEGRRYEGYGSRANARAYMVDLLSECVPDFDPPRDNRSLVFDGWEALCQAFAKPVFFEKSPQFLAHWAALSLLLEWIERTKLDVKVVTMVRNPHGAMYSAAKLFGTEPAERQFGWLETCVNLLAIEQMLPRGSHMRLRYEDLTERADGAFKDVCDFVGVAHDPAVGKGVRAGSVEKWRGDPGYGLALDPSVRQIAMRLGYSDTELDNPNASLRTEIGQSPVRRNRWRRWLVRRRDRLMQPMLLRLKNRARSSR